jgi:hypothetical protein
MSLSDKTIKEYKKYKQRDNNYKYKYKISLDFFRDKLIGQDFKCAICSLKQIFCGALQVDHCHKTGKIRSLLCSRCNKELSRFESKGSVPVSRSHLIDPNTEYTKYVKQHQGKSYVHGFTRRQRLQFRIGQVKWE